MSPAHGYDDWKTTNPDDERLGPYYECWACGEYHHMLDKNDRWVWQDGFRKNVLICDDCLAKGEPK